MKTFISFLFLNFFSKHSSRQFKSPQEVIWKLDNVHGKKIQLFIISNNCMSLYCPLAMHLQFAWDVSGLWVRVQTRWLKNPPAENPLLTWRPSIWGLLGQPAQIRRRPCWPSPFQCWIRGQWWHSLIRGQAYTNSLQPVPQLIKDHPAAKYLAAVSRVTNWIASENCLATSEIAPPIG